MTVFLKLTSAVAPRGPVFVNLEHVVSFSDQASGGTALKMTGGGLLVVAEKAGFIAGRIEEAGHYPPGPPSLSQ